MITSLSWVTAKIHFWSALEENTDCGLPMHTKFCLQNARSDNIPILHKWLDCMLLSYKQLLLVKHRTPESYAIYIEPTTSYNTGCSQRYNLISPLHGLDTVGQSGLWWWIVCPDLIVPLISRLIGRSISLRGIRTLITLLLIPLILMNLMDLRWITLLLVSLILVFLIGLRRINLWAICLFLVVLVCLGLIALRFITMLLALMWVRMALVMISLLCVVLLCLRKIAFLPIPLFCVVLLCLRRIALLPIPLFLVVLVWWRLISLWLISCHPPW